MGMKVWGAFVTLLTTAFWFAVGFGILCYKNGWRTLVLVMCWGAFCMLPAMLVTVFIAPHHVRVSFASFSTTADQNPYIAITGICLAGALFFWVYRVLIRPAIRKLFLSDSATAPPTNENQ